MGKAELIAMAGDTIGALVVLSLLVSMVLAVWIGQALVARDSNRRRGKWGINPDPVHCPQCGEPALAVRVPKGWRQRLWGGWTCATCGIDYDKWGQAVTGADGVGHREEVDEARHPGWTPPTEKPLPGLGHMRSVLRAGMTREELFQACDDLMEDHRLQLNVPAAPQTDVVGIHVAEGDMLLCFLIEERLAYVEYRGDVFLGG
jgi:hypothetical protein